MYGSSTLPLSAPVTEVAGSSTATVEVVSENGSAKLTTLHASPTSTSSAWVIVGGHTYSLGPGSLNTEPTSTASKGFVTSAISAATAAPSSTTHLQSGASNSARLNLILAGFAALVFGVAALL